MWLKDAAIANSATVGPATAPAKKAFAAKNFPADFLPAGAFESHALTLPVEPLRTSQDQDGHYFVASISGFRHPVRNPAEGKFLIYAQKRGKQEIQLPKDMFKVFSTVTSYEKYCRELGQKLVHDLEQRCRNRQLAEYQARDIFESHGLPVL